MWKPLIKVTNIPKILLDIKTILSIYCQFRLHGLILYTTSSFSQTYQCKLIATLSLFTRCGGINKLATFLSSTNPGIYICYIRRVNNSHILNISMVTRKFYKYSFLSRKMTLYCQSLSILVIFTFFFLPLTFVSFSYPILWVWTSRRGVPSLVLR